MALQVEAMTDSTRDVLLGCLVILAVVVGVAVPIALILKEVWK